MITKEEYESLLPYEADFKRAVKADYKLPTRREEDDLVISILRKYEPKEQVNRSCGNCMFRVYKRVGWLYYAYKEWMEKNTTTPTESTSSTEQVDTTSVKEGRKRSRKKTGGTKVVDEV